MRRRKFLSWSGATALGAMTPGLMTHLSAADAPTTDPAPTAPSIHWTRSLVIIELRGGNDGLNTIIPFSNPEYRRLRPTISIRESDIIRLDQRFGFHPALNDLKAFWDAGQCAAVLGVGYPEPNLSHFRGIEIWNRASSAKTTPSDGWLSRLYAAAAKSAPSDLLAHSLSFSAQDALAHEGNGPFIGHLDQNHFVLDDPDKFIADISVIPPLKDPTVVPPRNPALAHVRQQRQDITRIRETVTKLLTTKPFTTTFPPTDLGKQLNSVARFIAGGAICPTYKCTIGGFDTHSNQLDAHHHLLNQLSTALAAFRTALQSIPGAWDRTLVMTYSEFGRRANENGSAGTDHGTAAPHLLFGNGVKSGFHGEYPDLTNLEDGNLTYTTDFRRIYQGITKDFFGYSAPFLAESGLQPLSMLKTG